MMKVQTTNRGVAMGKMAHEDNPWSKEAEENQTKRKQSDINKMTWSEGEHTIRVMPPKVEGKPPFVKYIVHWVPVKTAKKDRPIIHAVDFKCPVCDFVSELWSEIHRLKEEEELTDKSPEVQKIAKQISKLRGKKTYDMNIIHRNDLKNDKGQIKIKRLVAGPTIWKSVIELGNSEKWGNPSAAGSRGYDLTVTVDGEGLKREYTILPDPDRRPLTEEELNALKEFGYDLAKLRKFSTAKEIFEVVKNAKSPLDNVDLKKVKKDLEAWSGESLSLTTATSSNSNDEDVSAPDDDDNAFKGEADIDADEPVTTSKKSSPEKETEENDENEVDPKEVARKEKIEEKEEKAFSKDESDEDEPTPSDSDPEVSATLNVMDCRGTYDGEDVGCQECSLMDDCKTLKKEFRTKADELEISIKDLSGVEIENTIKRKEKELAAKKPMGKMGKAGKAETVAPAATETKKRNLPF